jgi:hypothetical protein
MLRYHHAYIKQGCRASARVLETAYRKFNWICDRNYSIVRISYRQSGFFHIAINGMTGGYVGR